jgi:hypothetical protein
MRLLKRAFPLLLLFLATVAGAQEQMKAPPLGVSARLAAARTAFIKNAGGSDIPFNVVNSGFEGWGRFTLVGTPEKADIIVEVSAPDEDGGVTVSSKTTNSGRLEQSTSATRNVSATQVKMLVYDSKTKIALWSASEQSKFAMKQKSRQDNLVQAAQRLVAKFRERVEPPPAP